MGNRNSFIPPAPNPDLPRSHTNSNIMLRKLISTSLKTLPKPSNLLSHSPISQSLLTKHNLPSPNTRLFDYGFSSERAYSGGLLALNDLRDNPGATKQKKRKGRGIGSGLGKTAGRGHKGQKARGTAKFGFEGGQTPLRRRLPKRGFKNPFSLEFQPVGLGKIAKLINMGEIDSSELITMKILKDAGAVGKQIGDGVRLMGRGCEQIVWPIHLEVSRVTVRAKAAVEAAGGTVRKVHYNKLGLRALLKPEWFVKKGRLLPKAARPPPKLEDKVDSIGRLPAPTKPIPFPADESTGAAFPC